MPVADDFKSVTENAWGCVWVCMGACVCAQDRECVCVSGCSHERDRRQACVWIALQCVRVSAYKYRWVSEECGCGLWVGMCDVSFRKERKREIQSPMVDKRTFKVSHYLLLWFRTRKRPRPIKPIPEASRYPILLAVVTDQDIFNKFWISKF